MSRICMSTILMLILRTEDNGAMLTNNMATKELRRVYGLKLLPQPLLRTKSPRTLL